MGGGGGRSTRTWLIFKLCVGIYKSLSSLEHIIFSGKEGLRTRFCITVEGQARQAETKIGVFIPLRGPVHFSTERFCFFVFEGSNKMCFQLVWQHVVCLSLKQGRGERPSSALMQWFHISYRVVLLCWCSWQ